VTHPKRIHLDTDLGSDTDDLCALAMLLGWEDVDLVGVTTSTDPGGIRAGYTHHALRVASREDVPVRAGAEGSIAGLFSPLAFPDYWPEPINPRPSPVGEALELMEASLEAGATIVAVGPYTNLALLEAARPGLLTGNVVVMGGHVTTSRAGLPSWGVHDDFNVQQDRFAAYTVLSRCDPIVVPIAVSLEVTLRKGHLTRLRDAGALGKLIADQAEAHARDNGRTELGRAFEGLPDDLLNFHYDPLACAVAVDWTGVTIEKIPTRLELREGRLWMSESEDEDPLRVATEVEAEPFEEAWLRAVERASSTPRAR
jgi:inosine-uridine nucleoside N-ribohydrolase